MPSPAQPAHGLFRAEQPRHRRRAEGDQRAGLDDVDLLAQVGQARCHFRRLGLAVAGLARRHVGAAFEDVADVHVVAGEAHRADDFGEQLSGFADERLALQILVLARRFADEHQLGLGIADAEDDLRARLHEMRAERAGQHRAAEGGETRGFRSAGRGGNQRWTGKRRGHRLCGCRRAREARERGGGGAQFHALLAEAAEGGVDVVEGGLKFGHGRVAGTPASTKSAGMGDWKFRRAPVRGWVKPSRHAWSIWRAKPARRP